MKFKYVNPSSVEEACTELERPESTVLLSGGQSLLPVLRQGLSTFDRVVDLNSISEFDYIDVEDDQIRIGFLTRYVDVVNSDAVRSNCPVLAETAEEIGDRQVRNRGTICGSVAHADPAGDPPVLATLLEAEIEARSSDGAQVYDGSEFFHGFYETELGENEIVTEVRFPALTESQGAAYEKWEAGEGAYPVATAGSLVSFSDGVFSDVRITTGAVEGGPMQMTDAEEYLTGKEPIEEHLVEAIELVGEQTNPIDDFEGSAEFKTELVKTLAQQSLDRAIGRSGGVA